MHIHISILQFAASENSAQISKGHIYRLQKEIVLEITYFIYKKVIYEEIVFSSYKEGKNKGNWRFQTVDECDSLHVHRT